jgi:hypothetical protein
MDFQRKLIRLLIEETSGKTLNTGLPAGVTTEIVEAMASQLGKFVALSCGGNAEVMSRFLEGASAYMFEVAADTQKAGAFIGDPANWHVIGKDGKPGGTA